MDPATPTAADLASIRRLLAACDLPYSDLTPTHLASFRVLRQADGTPAAVVGLELFGEAALLRSLAVSEGCRGRGLGQRLTDEAEALARSCRVGTLYLLTTTAAAFFRQRGYRVVERSAVPPAVRASREFTALCPADAICLSRALDRVPDPSAAR